MIKYLCLVCAFVTLLSSCAQLSDNSKSTPHTLSYVASLQSGLQRDAQKAFETGQYQKAASLYEKLYEEEPDNTLYLMQYAESLRLGGDNGKALQRYDQLLEKDPGALHAKEGKGLAYVQEGNLKKAQVLFSEVLKADASRWRTINALGVIHSLSGQKDEAMQYYQMASQVSEENPAVLNNIGLSVALDGDIEGGMVILKKALLELSADDMSRQKIEHNLALVYGISGRMDKAQEILEKHLPPAAVYNNLGFYAKLANDRKLARTYLSKSLSSSPVHYEKAWNNLQGLEGSSSFFKEE